uniref:Uncharacterized protein n=1 Tax=Arundo donax TaxID=35708 RepID=A0A0A9GPQ3_ARUDO
MIILVACLKSLSRVDLLSLRSWLRVWFV